MKKFIQTLVGFGGIAFGGYYAFEAIKNTKADDLFPKKETPEKIEKTTEIVYIEKSGIVYMMAGGLEFQFEIPANFKLTPREIYLRAWNLLEECGVCDELEKVWVDTSVDARVLEGDLGNTIEDVIFKPGAYSWIKLKGITPKHYYSGDREKLLAAIQIVIDTASGKYDLYLNRENGERANAPYYYNPNTRFGCSKFHENLPKDCDFKEITIPLKAGINQWTNGGTSFHKFYVRMNEKEIGECLEMPPAQRHKPKC